MKYPILTAQEAATLTRHQDTLGIGGFSSVGTPKAVPAALAAHAQALHAAGKEFKVGLITGGATGSTIDSALAQADAVSFRTPFQSNKDMRTAINDGRVAYYDVHLSLIGQDVRYGFLPKIDVALIEASELTDNGEITLTTSVGISPTLIQQADRIDPFLVTVEPKPEDTPIYYNTHYGQEFNLVIEGRMLLSINGKDLVLEAGDSLYFDSSLPHGMKALDGKAVKFLAVVMS